MRKVAHQTYMDINQVWLDALILAWTFIYTFHCVYGQWRLWQCCAQAQVRCLLNMHGQLQSGAICLNFGLKLYLHLSLCVRAVKALAMLRTSTGTSLTNMHGQLQSGARCLNLAWNFFLYRSLSLWAVTALAMLRTSECASKFLLFK